MRSALGSKANKFSGGRTGVTPVSVGFMTARAAPAGLSQSNFHCWGKNIPLIRFSSNRPQGDGRSGDFRSDRLRTDGGLGEFIFRSSFARSGLAEAEEFVSIEFNRFLGRFHMSVFLTCPTKLSSL